MYYILKLIARLPLCVLQFIALCVAYFFLTFNLSLKRITRINIRLVYPDLSEKEQNHRIRTSVISQCLTMIEFIKCWGMPPEYSLSLLKKIDGLQHFQNAVNNGRGTIVVIPHFGCWELLNAWINLYAAPKIMYKPSKHKSFDRYILHARQMTNAELVPTNESGVRALFKHLKNGGLTVILPDHLPKNSGGIYSDFFGQQTLCSTLVSKLANKTQCNVVGLSCIRQDNWSAFHVHCYPLSENILSKDLDQSVSALNQDVQMIVAQAPEQYLWGYKRFRVILNKENIYNKN